MQHGGLVDRLGATFNRLRERVAGVVHPEGDVTHAVAMRLHVLRNALRVRTQLRADRRGEHEADLALLEEVARTIAATSLGPFVRHEMKAEGGAIVDGGLLRVPDVELDVVGAVDRERVLDGRSQLKCRRSHDLYTSTWRCMEISTGTAALKTTLQTGSTEYFSTLVRSTTAPLERS